VSDENRQHSTRLRFDQPKSTVRRSCGDRVPVVIVRGDRTIFDRDATLGFGSEIPLRRAQITSCNEDALILGMKAQREHFTLMGANGELEIERLGVVEKRTDFRAVNPESSEPF